MRKWDVPARSVGLARGLRRLVRNPVTPDEANRTVADEVRRREERFLTMLDGLVWPFPAGPTHRLLTHAGFEPEDVRRACAERGLVGTLELLRDQGVYVDYDEYHGRTPARRGSAEFSFRPDDFFNPVTRGDYMATTGGSRSAGTPVELSFAWQRRQGVQRAVQMPMLGMHGAPGAVWLPVFPSAAGFGAVMKTAAGGNAPERWFSQVPDRVTGVSAHKQLANRFMPALNAMARTGLPRAEHVPTDRPEPVVRWLRDALDRAGRAWITGYASSLTAGARWAVDHGVDLSGSVAFPAAEPVTAAKLATLRAAGIQPHPQYAFVPEGTVALSCAHCPDEEYHVWDQDVAVVTRGRQRSDGAEVDAFCWTSLAMEAPRVMVNVENDDYGAVRYDAACDCALGGLGLTTRVSAIRGISKVVAAGITLEGESLDELTDVALPGRLGGGPGDYQFVEQEGTDGTTITLRVHPRVGEVDEAAATEVVRAALARSDNGLLAHQVWMPAGRLRIDRSEPAVTRAGKTLAYERIGAEPAVTATTD